MQSQHKDEVVIATENDISSIRFVGIHLDTPLSLRAGFTRCISSEFGLPPPQQFIRRKVSSPRPPSGPLNNDDSIQLLEWDIQKMDPYDGILEALMNLD